MRKREKQTDKMEWKKKKSKTKIGDNPTRFSCVTGPLGRTIGAMYACIESIMKIKQEK